MRLKVLGTGVVALVLFAALAGGAWAQSAPGVTDTEVVIGITTPLSGPAAAWGSTGLGAEAWAKHINEQGGVHGRKIRVVMKDDAYVPGRAVANITEMKDTVFSILGLLGSAVMNASKDLIAEAKIPTIYPYGDPQIWVRQGKDKTRYVFAVYTDYGDEGEFLVQQAAKIAGAKKIAVFYQNDEYGKGYLEGIRRGIKGLGGQVSVVAEVPHEVQDRDLGTHALKLRDSGADVVIPAATTTNGANAIKEMAKVGYRPRIFAPFPFGDHQVMFRLLGDLWEGVHYNGNIPTTSDPESQRIIQLLIKQEPKLKGREAFALAGGIAMMTAVEGLKRAGKNLTRESYLEAMEGVKNWVPENLKWAPITFGPGRHHGLNTVRMYRANKAADQSFVVVTDFQTFPPHF
jgi:ABC-type branched-subunit amino acid transport system substrate-binding protein